MIQRNINNGKLKISKKLIALMLAGTCSFSLVGCQKESKGKIKVGAIEESGNNTQFVGGAVIQIKDENNHVIDNWTSSNTYHVTTLKEGDYTASLVLLPEGYINNFETIEFKKTSTDEDTTINFELEKEPIRKENIGESNSNYLSIQYSLNDSSIEFTEKVFTQVELLDLNNRVINAWIHGDSEIYKLENLEPGTYIVRLVYAPEGYKLVDNDKMINITNNGEKIYVNFSLEENCKELTNNPTKKIKNR